MKAFWKNRRLLLGVAVVAAVAAMAFWPSSTAVDVETVQRGPLVVTVDEEGETRVRDRFVVSAPVAGRLERIELEPGDAVVERETVVATLRPTDPALLDTRTRAELTAAAASTEAALGTATAERERAKATLDRMQTSLRRGEQLREASLLSSDELEARQTAVDTAREGFLAADFAVSRARHELEMAKVRLSRQGGGGAPIRLRAPVDGVVLRRYHESQTVVAAGERLVEIGDPARIEIVADYLSSEAVRVSAGDRVAIEQWGGGRTLAGRVQRVEPSGFMKVSALGVEEQRVNVIIDFDDPAEATRLGDGYRVEVRIVVAETADALKVPIGALFRREGSWAVFVVEGGRAVLRTLVLGERNDLEAEVRDGLEAGEGVIVYPPDTLEDGGRIDIRQ
jgi:HlyD family secretion protein